MGSFFPTTRVGVGGGESLQMLEGERVPGGGLRTSWTLTGSRWFYS